MQICKPELCTGCSVCLNICPKSAIAMLPDSKGFLHPVTDEEKCVSCGLCVKMCPQNSAEILGHPIKCYAALNRNDKIRDQSSSGGIFSVFAEYVIKKCGVVFGAAFSEDMHVIHTFVENHADLGKLRGSKYVQSNIDNSYRKVKNMLLDGKYVLFSGTPCQVAGLNRYLGDLHSSDRLLTIDILCHGVPSPIVFLKFLSYIENNYKSSVSNIVFKDKDPSWSNYCMKIWFDSGAVINRQRQYNAAFLSDLFLRESCYSCKYSQKNRPGDITIGDYWGYVESDCKHIENDEKGISCVIVNTEKGISYLKKISRSLCMEERSFDDIAKINTVLKHPTKKPEDYGRFWIDYYDLSWDEMENEYFIVTEAKDTISQEKRERFSRPFNERHFKHRLFYTFVDIKKIFKKFWR